MIVLQMEIKCFSANHFKYCLRNEVFDYCYIYYHQILRTHADEMLTDGCNDPNIPSLIASDLLMAFDCSKSKAEKPLSSIPICCIS